MAFNSLLFLYKQVLGIEIPAIEGVLRARRPRRLPAVFLPNEAKRIIAQMEKTPRLVASLFYGAGLRLTEAIRLRVKDIDFETGLITVRDGKGFKGRTTILPPSLTDDLKTQLANVRMLHTEDLSRGFGLARLPLALKRKYAFGDSMIFGLFRNCLDTKTLGRRRYTLI